MTHLFVAEFETAQLMLRAAKAAAEAGHIAQDALSPFPVPGVLDHLSPRRKQPVGWAMVIAGGTAALAAYGMQAYSAAIDYPVISGARPFNAWQVFLLVMFEACILFACIAGFIALLRDCRLPALHHPLFEIAAVERATQDRFFLVFEAAEDERRALNRLLPELNPLTLHELAL